MNINEVYHMDCLLGMKKFDQENGQVVDTIITDPPYNISMENQFHTMKRSGIDFG